MIIPTIQPYTSFSDAQSRCRSIMNREITFDKTMWMDWDEKVQKSILVIKFLMTYYKEYDKVKNDYQFIFKNAFSLKWKSIEIHEINSYGGWCSGYEFRVSTFWNYEIGVGANNTRSGKYDLYSKAQEWFRELVWKMESKIGQQAARVIINHYKGLCAENA